MDFPIIKTKNLVKLYLKGKIQKVYGKMFDEANRIAGLEVEQKLATLEIEELKEVFSDTKTEEFNKIEFLENLQEYREKRVNYHMDKMYKLLMKEIESKKRK